HELLGQAGAVAEQGLGQLPDLADELLCRHLGGVLDRVVDAEVPDHALDVDVPGQRAHVAQGVDLEVDVVGRATHQQTQKGQAPRLVQASRDAVVEEGDPTSRLDEDVAPVQITV